MKLTDKEARILALVELEPDMSLEVLHQQTGYAPHVIRYTLHKLQMEGVLRRLTFIDMFSLGYEDYGLYFSVGALEKKQQTELLAELERSPYVTWLVELGGDFQYCAAVYAKHVFEFREYIHQLSEQFAQLFFHKSFSARVRLTRFNHTYLAPDIARVSHSTPVRHTASIDEQDKRILQTLNDHPDWSRRQSADALRIPFSTFRERVKRLEEQDVLRGSLYMIDPSKIGMHAFQLLVYARGMSSHLNQEIARFAETHPNIVYFVECIGEWDFEVGVEVQDPQQVRELVQALYERLGTELIMIKVSSVFRCLKMKFYH